MLKDQPYEGCKQLHSKVEEPFLLSTEVVNGTLACFSLSPMRWELPPTFSVYANYSVLYRIFFRKELWIIYFYLSYLLLKTCVYCWFLRFLKTRFLLLYTDSFLFFFLQSYFLQWFGFLAVIWKMCGQFLVQPLVTLQW